MQSVPIALAFSIIKRCDELLKIIRDIFLISTEPFREVAASCIAVLP